MRNRFDRVCVVGLGHIGLPTAAMLATKGVDVVGVDTDIDRVSTINSGAAPIIEPDLKGLVERAVASGRLRARERATPADAFIIAVPTPLARDHSPDLSDLRKAAEGVAPVLEAGNLVVLESTSPVGTTESLCKWFAQVRTDLRFPHEGAENSEIHVAYSPERVLPGQILIELVDNDRVVGGVTRECAEAAIALFRTFVRGHLCVTSARTAELVKLAENSFRDVNIAFANEMSRICHALDIDPWELTELANHHPRVNMLRPGPGVGGHCIAVDPWFAVHAAPESTPLLQAARQVNDAKPSLVVEQILAAGARFSRPVVACLGLAYKADVGDTRGSPAISVVSQLAGAIDGRILVSDPYIDVLPEELGDTQGVELVPVDDALAMADVIVLLTDHARFASLDVSDWSGKAIVDPRGAWSLR